MLVPRRSPAETSWRWTGSPTYDMLRSFLARKIALLTTSLIFVYRGEEWPAYVRHSIALATETAGVPIVVLTNLPPVANLPGVQWEPTGSFYDGQRFKSFAKASLLPAGFRSGFWLHAVERFFILNEFAKHARLHSFFHGELDCLFFDLPQLQEEIDASRRHGFFFPRETVDRGLGSLIYVNNPQALTSVCDHFVKTASLGTADASQGNEMHLLGLLPTESADGAFHSLPTAEVLFRTNPRSSWPVMEFPSSSLTDGAVLGRWVFGMDPANTGGLGTRNRIQNHPQLVAFDYPMSDLRFRASRKAWGIDVRHVEEGTWWKVNVIHVHSKIHRKITKGLVARTVDLLNRGKPRRLVYPEIVAYQRYPKRAFRHVGFLISSKKVRVDQARRIRQKLRL